MKMAGGLKKTQQPINAFYFDGVATSATEYNNVQGGYIWSTSISSRSQIVPCDGYFTNFYWRLPSTESTVTHQMIFVVSAVEKLTLALGSGEASGILATSQEKIRVKAGNYVVWKGISGGAGDAYFNLRVSCVFVPDVPGKTILMASTADTTQAAVAEITRPFAGYISWGTDLAYTQRAFLVPCSGTISELYVRMNTNPGAGNSYDYAIYKKTTADATIEATSVTVQLDSTNYWNGGEGNPEASPSSVTVEKGDWIAMGYVPNSTPTTGNIQNWGFVFTPAEPGNTWMAGGTGNNLNASTKIYNVALGSANWNANEFQIYVPTPACKAKSFIAALLADAGTYAGPGASPNSYTFSLRNATADSALSVEITESNYTSEVEDTERFVEIAQGGVTSISSDPNSTPTVRDAMYAWVAYIEPEYELDLAEDLVVGVAEGADAADELDDSFEDATLDAFTGTTVYSGDTIYVGTEQASHGVYSAICNLGGDGSCKAELDYSVSASEIWVNFDIFFEDTVNLPTNAIHGMIDIPYTVDGATNAFRLSMTDIGGAERIGFGYREDGADVADNDNAFDWEADKWYRIKVHLLIDGAAGVAEYQICDALTGAVLDSDSATGIDNDNDGATIEQVQIGCTYAGWTSGTIVYVDNVQINTSNDPDDKPSSIENIDKEPQKNIIESNTLTDSTIKSIDFKRFEVLKLKSVEPAWLDLDFSQGR